MKIDAFLYATEGPVESLQVQEVDFNFETDSEGAQQRFKELKRDLGGLNCVCCNRKGKLYIATIAGDVNEDNIMRKVRAYSCFKVGDKLNATTLGVKHEFEILRDLFYGVMRNRPHNLQPALTIESQKEPLVFYLESQRLWNDNYKVRLGLQFRIETHYDSRLLARLELKSGLLQYNPALKVWFGCELEELPDEGLRKYAKKRMMLEPKNRYEKVSEFINYIYGSADHFEIGFSGNIVRFERVEFVEF
jgi:hypothetical protein